MNAPSASAWETLDRVVAARPRLTAVLFGLLALGMSLIWMRGGPTVPSGDSVAYLESGRSLLEVQRYGWVVWELTADARPVPAGFEVNTIWPPGMSVLLAGAIKSGVDLQLAARIYIAVFAALAAALGFGVARLLTRSAAAAVVISLLHLSLFAVQWWILESWMAEGLYVAITFGGILIFHRLATASRTPLVLWALFGLGVSSVYYLKSAGPGFVMAAVLSVILAARGTPRERFMAACAVAFGGALGAAPWLLRNLSLGTIGSGGGRVPHPVLVSLFDLGRLFVPRHGSFAEGKVAVALFGALGLACLGMASALLFPRERVNRGRTLWAQWFASGPGAVFAGVYLVLFIFAISTGVALRKTAWFETRYWMEISVLILAFGWIAVRAGLEKLEGLPRRVLGLSAVAALAVTVLANGFEAARTWSASRLTIPTDAQRLHARQELVRALQPLGRVAFVSNEKYRFGIETGLVASATEEEARRRVANPAQLRFVYVAYPENALHQMALVKTPPEVPAGWKQIGRLGAATLHVPALEATGR